MPDNIPEIIASLGLAYPVGIFVRSLITYLKPAWSKVDAALKPLINITVAFSLGAVLSITLHIALGKGRDIPYMLAIGIVAGVFAALYEDGKDYGPDAKRKDSLGVMKLVQATKSTRVKKAKK